MKNKKQKTKVKIRLFSKLRAYFLAGVLVTAPIAITAAVAWWFIGMVDDKILPLIPAHLNPVNYIRDNFGFEYGLPGLGLIILIIAMILIGALTAGLLGRWMVNMGEAILQRMPFIRSLYNGSKQILETVLKQQSDAFSQAILVRWPHDGLWTIAFVTANTSGEAARKLGGNYINIYVPTTPNPTGGYMVFAHRDDIKPLDMPVDEAIKMIIAMGIVTPDDLTQPSLDLELTKVENKD